mmetsp:Transcript_977/g.1390  ORF Transcript_977/g.1390 Transcript_977/m.1390 type:complete len:276 (-) Transcript_977:26-853(-)
MGNKATKSHHHRFSLVDTFDEVLGELSEQVFCSKRNIFEKKDQFHFFYEAGRLKQEQANFQAAIEYFQQCFLIDPFHVDLNFKLGESYMELNDRIEASGHFHRVIELKPDHVDALRNLGIINYEKNDLPAALSYFKKITAFKVDDSQSLIFTALILDQMGDQLGAINANMRAIELDKMNEIPVYNAGNIYYEMKRYDESIAMYFKVLKLNPDHSDALFNIAISYQAKGDLVLAIQYYLRAQQKNPSLRKNAMKQIDTLVEKVNEIDNPAPCGNEL